MYSILLVEDEFHINELLKETLEKKDMDVYRHFLVRRRGCFWKSINMMWCFWI